MSKQNIKTYFGHHGLIRELPIKTLTALMTPYLPFFKSKQVELNFEIERDTPEYEALLRNLRDALMDITLSDELGKKLSDTLDEIALINKHQEHFNTYIESHLPLWWDGLVQLGLELDLNKQLSIIVALYIDERKEIRKTLSLLVSRIECLDTSGLREYKWYGEFDEEQEDGTKKRRPFKKPLLSKLDAKIPEFEEKLTQGFNNYKYDTECKLTLCAKPNEDKGKEKGKADKADVADEITILVEHSGRDVVKETMEQGKAGIVEYTPLTRSIVVLDCSNKVLRIKSGAEWMYNLLLPTFSEFFMGNEDAFVQQQIYDFSPIYRKKNLTEAFSLDEYRHIITKVTIVNIRHDVKGFKPGHQIILSDRFGEDISSMWKEQQFLHAEKISSITLRLSIKGCNTRVTVKIDKEKGLTVGRLNYYKLVRSWLRDRGFIKDHPVKEYKSRLSPNPDENAFFWPVVHSFLAQGKATKDSIYSLEDLAPGMGDFMWQFLEKEDGDRDYQRTYTDSNNKVWDVMQDKANGTYYLSDDEVYLGLKEGEEIDASVVEFLPINRKELITAIQKALFGNCYYDINENKGGVYRLGELLAHGVTVFLATGANWKSAFTGRNTHDASIAVLSFTEKCPDEYADKVEQDQLQHGWLQNLLYWDGKEKQLKLRQPLSSYLHETIDRLGENPLKPYKVWPGVYPHDRKLFLVEIKIGFGKATIRYGNDEWQFAYDDVEIFKTPDRTKATTRKQRATAASDKVVYNANVTNLLKAINLCKKYGDEGFPLKDIALSSLKNLNVAIGKFLRTNDCIYEEVPGHPHRYRLTFAKYETDEEVDLNAPKKKRKSKSSAGS